MFNVENFINTFNTTGNSLYLGIGRPEYWGVDTSPTSISDTPSLPYNNIISTDRDWSDMMHMKLVNPAYISNGIFKEMWAPNTIYDAYRHDYGNSSFTAGISSVYNGQNAKVTSPSDISQAKYYVITASYNIYICLKQGTVGGTVVASTQNPDTGTSMGYGMFSTSDGYLWKFMSVTTPADVVSFSTDTYHPVETLVVAPGINDPYYPQYNNQQTSAANKQGVYVINVVNGGSGYNGGVAGNVSIHSGILGNVSVFGDGAGLTGTMSFGSGGVITNIVITNPGSGYTYLTLSVTGGNGLIVDVIYTPSWGLGADPVQDLCAFYCIVNSTLNSADGGIFTIANSYRKICLIANPTNYNSTSVATSQFLDATISIPLQTSLVVDAYASGQVITDSITGKKGRVVDWNSTTGILRVICTWNENSNNSGASAGFAVGATISPSTGVVQSIGMIPPTVQPGSGHIIYVEYRTPIMRSQGQTENIVLVLEY